MTNSAKIRKRYRSPSFILIELVIVRIRHATKRLRIDPVLQRR